LLLCGNFFAKLVKAKLIVNLFIYYPFFLLLLLHWGYTVKFTKLVEFNPSIILLYPTSPVPGIVSTGLTFPITYMCTQHFYHIHPPPSPPTGPHHLDRTCFAFLFCFCKKKKKKGIFVCLRWLYMVFHCDISMYICIIT
jgi:hypothetical protein